MSVLSRMINVFRSRRLSAELDEEQQFHLHEQIDHLIAGGMQPDEAARFARRRLGNPLRVRESSLDIKVLGWLESLIDDARFGCRMLWKDRTTMTAAVISLSLALGACSAAFSLIDALLLRPLPVPHADRLFYVTYPESRFERGPGPSREHDSFSYAQFQTFEQSAGTGVQLFGDTLSVALQPADFANGNIEDEPVRVERIASNGFGVLGVAPAAGRLFATADDTLGSTPAAVLSYEFWSRRFDRASSVVGSTVTVGTNRFRIVGVARPGFTGLRPGYLTDIWIPLTAGIDPRVLNAVDATFITVWGRDNSGQAGLSDLRLAWHNFRRDHAGVDALPPGTPKDQIADYINTPLTIQSGEKGADSLFRFQFRRPLLVFAAFAGLLLLICASNVASLLTGRAVGREREMALRIAIGAGRGRLIRQLIVESSLLALLACLVGIAIGTIAAPLLVRQMGASNFPAWLELRLDWRLIGFMSLAGACATILFGTLPALRASGAKPEEALKASARQSSSGTRVLRPLLPVQVAFSFALLFLSGLLLTSFERLIHLDVGFSPDHVILYRLSANQEHPEAQAQLLDRLSHTAFVDSVALSQQAPMGGAFAFVMTPFLRFPGRDIERIRPIETSVSPNFFRTMRIPLLQGREFNWHDGADAAIVNDAFVRQFYPDRRALGQRFERMGDDGKPMPFEVVGVVANSLFNNLREPVRPTFYTPLGGLNGAALEVRTKPDPRPLVLELRREIESVDPGLHVRDWILQSARIANTLVSERLLALLAAFFAIAALTLIAVGLHGVVNYFVVRRTKEIGIRMALGATRAGVVRLIAEDVAVMIVVGLIAGGITGRVLARYAESLLFEVKPADAWSLAAPLAAVVVVCLLAALRPAATATRVDPAVALRDE